MFKEEIKNDFSVRDENFYKLMIQCGLIATFLFFSIFWAPSVYVALVISAIILIFTRSINKIYILMFLLPFYNIFRYQTNNLVFCSYLLILSIFLLSIEYVVKLIKRERKLDWKILIPFIILSIYFIMPYGSYSLMTALRMESTLIICYLAFEFRAELDLKQLLFSLMIGLIISFGFYPFRYLSDRLNSFLSVAMVGDMFRFSGLTTDPNYFSVEIILVLSLLTQLYFNNTIRIIYFPLFLVFSVAGFLTFSKSFFIVYVLLAIFILFNYFIKHRKIKKSIYRVVTVLFLILLLGFLLKDYLIIILKRFTEDINITDEKSNLFNSITTGRSELWKLYILECVSSLLSIIFGFGNAAPGVITNYGYQPVHNLYIETLYHYGIVGVSLIITVIVFCSIKTSVLKNISIYNVLPTMSILIMLFSLNGLISYRPYLLIIILAVSLSYRTEQIMENKLNKEENKIKSDNLLLSIIIPIYNVEKYLKKCVDSICEQKLINTEILLVDDGSTDNSGLIAEDLKNKYNNVRVFHKENGGLSDARNFGISHALGKYVLFIDSDDYVEDNFIEIYNYLNDEYELILVGMIADYINHSKIIKYDITRKINNENLAVLNCLEVCTKKNSACMKVIKRDFILEHRLFFSDGFSEDFNWFGRACCYLKSVTITDLVYYHYIAEREGSLMNTFRKSKFYDVIDHAKEIVKEMNNVKLNKKIRKRILQFIGFNILSIFRNIKYLKDNEKDEIIKLLKDNYSLIKHQKPLVMKIFLMFSKIFGFKKAYKYL